MKKATRARRQLRGRPPRASAPGVSVAAGPALKRELMGEAESVLMPLGEYVERVVSALEPRDRISLAIDREVEERAS